MWSPTASSIVSHAARVGAITITRPAPISQEDFAANNPTGPAPNTTTVSPFVWPRPK